MLVAYYSKGCDSSNIFGSLKIDETDNYKEHLNKHNVIHLNMQSFLSMTNNIHDMINFMSEEVLEELEEEYNIQNKRNILSLYFSKIQAKTRESFIFVIDEWNCIFREYKEDEKAVARYIEEAHLDTSVLTYNNKNALSYTISLAYITARNHYTIVSELPGGKGYADIVFIPKKDKPAMIVELKWNKDANTVINQIKNKVYINALDGYRGDILLVGISYNPDNQSDDYKQHECIIEKIKI